MKAVIPKFDLELYGMKEFYPKLNKKKYLVLKIDTIDREKYMVERMKEYILGATKETAKLAIPRFLAMDFEFNKVAKNNRDVALMQINMEDSTDIGMIFILHPPSLNQNTALPILIELLTTPNIIKIIHGGESLDIPYLFGQLLKSRKNIEKFCNNLYDTKYLCDYMNIITNDIGKTTSCSIYNLLETNNIITKNKFEELNRMSDKIDIPNVNNINIKKLDFGVMKYALYDVLFLPELLKVFLKKDNIYTKVIPEITNLINKHKREVEDEFSNLETIINKHNNYFMLLNKSNNNRIILKELWDIYHWFFESDIKKINYFKRTIETLTKLIIYSNLDKYYDVHITKEELIKEDYFTKYLKWLENNYNNIYKLLLSFNKKISQELNPLN
jgi:hypothetical protein